MDTDADVSTRSADRTEIEAGSYHRTSGLEEALELAEDRAAAAERRLEAKNLLLSEFEHKLKSSFLVLQGWAQMLDDNWDDLTESRRAAGVHSIRIRTEEVVHEARKMLIEARAESMIVELKRAELDLARVLAAAAGNASTSHRFVYAGEPEVIAFTDQGAVEQALSQLLENAVMYSPPGTRVTLSARYVDDATCELTLSDEGPGVPDGLDIFGPFVRGSRDRPGSGIGLYIVRRLVDALGGSITASNIDGGGACFAVRLPRS